MKINWEIIEVVFSIAVTIGLIMIPITEIRGCYEHEVDSRERIQLDRNQKLHDAAIAVFGRR